MSGETTHFKIKYSESADETKAFPTEVSKPGAETIDKALWEGNKVGAEQKYEAIKAYTKAQAEAGVEPSATRAAFVMLGSTSLGTFTVGGVTMVSGSPGLWFIVPAGQKWKYDVAVEASTILL